MNKHYVRTKRSKISYRKSKYKKVSQQLIYTEKYFTLKDVKHTLRKEITSTMFRKQKVALHVQHTEEKAEDRVYIQLINRQKITTSWQKPKHDEKTYKGIQNIR